VVRGKGRLGSGSTSPGSLAAPPFLTPLCRTSHLARLASLSPRAFPLSLSSSMSAHSPHSSHSDSDSDDDDFAASSGSERGASPAAGPIAEAAPLEDDEAEALRADAEEAGEVVSGRRRRRAGEDE